MYPGTLGKVLHIIAFYMLIVNMALKACGQIDDKQRRYISKIPILSKNYKDKHLDIERREAELSLMRKELLEMSEGRPSPSVYLTVDHGEDNGRSVTTELLKPVPASTTLILSKSGVEPLRSVIITPKGTKQRGKGI